MMMAKDFRFIGVLKAVNIETNATDLAQKIKLSRIGIEPKIQTATQRLFFENKQKIFRRTPKRRIN